MTKMIMHKACQNFLFPKQCEAQLGDHRKFKDCFYDSS